MAGGAAAHVQVAPYGEWPKAVAVVHGRLSQPPVHLSGFKKSAMKTALTPIAGAILLSLTTVTIAQADEKPNPVETTAPLTLPAEGVSITDTNGRKIIATVLNRDANGITIRMADGKEHQLPWNKLSRATIDMLDGKPPAPKSLQMQAIERDYVEEIKSRMLPHEKWPHDSTKIKQRIRTASMEARKQLEGLSAKELQKRYLEKDPLVMTAVYYTEMSWASKEYGGVRFGDPGRVGYYTRTDENYIRALEIKDPDVEEIVSLRDNFKRLGVKPTQQTKDACSIYSLYHMVQYAILKDGGTPPSATAFVAAHGRKFDRLSHVVGRLYGKRPLIRDLSTGLNALNEEIVKEELRNGRPCRVSVSYVKTSIRHDIVLIGFHIKDGKTRYEYIDSNMVPTENQSGYAIMPNKYIPGRIDWVSPISLEFR